MPDTDAKGAAQSKEVRGALAVGTRLRSYEVVSVLGQGAFGITYRARDSQLNRDVAIKEYLPTALAVREDGTSVVPRSSEYADEFAWGRERFLDEARTLARLEDSPGIIRVYDFLEANETAYMVMALARGETLDRRLLSDGLFSQPAIERLLFPLLDGLEAVHAIGFLHRDIKPSNIIVDGRGQPTLIDFGASRGAMADRSTAMTAIFTPGYAAPEQFTSAALGPWTDIYGLSATLYHAITGKTPPRGIDRVFEDRYEPLTLLKPAGFTQGLLSAIDAGLAVQAARRPQSIAEWRAMFSHGATAVAPAALGSSSLNTSATVVIAKRGKAAGRSRRTVWLALAIVCAVLAAAGYYGTSFLRGPLVGGDAGVKAGQAPAPAAVGGIDTNLPQRFSTWVGTAQCAFWQDGRGGPTPITIAIPGGQGSGANKGNPGLVVTLDISGETYSGTIRTRYIDGSKTLVGPFSGAISGNEILARASVHAEKATDIGPNDSECTIKLAGSGSRHDGPWFGGITCSGERTPVQGTLWSGVGTVNGDGVAVRVQLAGNDATLAVTPQPGKGPAGPGQLTGKLSGRSIYAKGVLGGDVCTISLVGP